MKATSTDTDKGGDAPHDAHLHTAASLADVLEKDYALSEGAQLFLSGHEWGLVVAALRAATPNRAENRSLAEYLNALAKDLDEEGLGVSAAKCREAADALSSERSSRTDVTHRDNPAAYTGERK